MYNKKCDDPNYYYLHFEVSKLEKVLENIKRIFREIGYNTCMNFQKQDDKVENKIGINFFLSSDSNTVKLSENLQYPTTVNLTAGVYKNKTHLSFFIGVAMGIITEIQRFDSDKYITVYKKNVNDSFYEKYYKQVDLENVSYITGSDFNFKSPMLVDPYFLSSSSEATYNITLDFYNDYQYFFKYTRNFQFNDYKHMYNYHCKTEEQTDCENGGFKPNKKYYGDKCYCPEYFTGKKCDLLLENTPSCGVKKQNYDAHSSESDLEFTHVQGKCYYSITSKSNGNVSVVIKELKFEKNDRSNGNYVEFLLHDDKGAAGLKLCKDRSEIKLPSLSKKVLIVLFGMGDKFSLTLKYQAVTETSLETV
uniref:Astacin domain-containing protein n=1 Tax=Strongyloides papillosus TaxID=174720 RepID=A0A0N5CFL7_STREA